MAILEKQLEKNYMETFDDSYVRVLKRILADGTKKNNRTGMPTISVFCDTLVASDAQGFEGFPISNLRKIHWKGAIIETLWLLGIHMSDKRYSHLRMTNTKYLNDYNVRYWNPWADEYGNLGSVYGEQLIKWKSFSKNKVKMDCDDPDYLVSYINQFQNVIDTLRTNPDDRRLVCTMWNPAELKNMALPPCHHTHEFYSRIGEDGKRYLDIRWIQRSCDMPLGIPYNVLQYTLIDKIVALATNHIPGRVYGCLGDCHIYENQIDAVKEIIRRYDAGEHTECPKPVLEISEHLKNKMIDPYKDINLDGSDFVVNNYAPLAGIKIDVSV